MSAGDVISSLQLRKGVLQDMQEAGGRCSLTVHVPTRGLIGYKGVFTSITRGEGLLNRAFLVCSGSVSHSVRFPLCPMPGLDAKLLLFHTQQRIGKRPCQSRRRAKT